MEWEVTIPADHRPQYQLPVLGPRKPKGLRYRFEKKADRIDARIRRKVHRTHDYVMGKAARPLKKNTMPDSLSPSGE
jgi:hypothetical protein